ncbi:glutathione S-transferase family protein [Paralimibaculum aggregatum]|uniref:Glutathione S-transferase family protein n=1 Tax=Paralimibaculum aggregatum TaxID=3036245 RepID=A0ABQ6LMG9_9RHOB|nr:glutathione S-transferase family protein [Limibaculum sp. NKW23]GMG83480.1 glutathione S-transferase family protein [Limibaculum sp. NKW23]
MGLLIDGKWHDRWYDTRKSDGKFVRDSAKFRNWVTADGAPGPSGEGGFRAESGRYHLYVSLACPWAHRTLIFRSLKGLADHVTVDVVHPLMQGEGWTFDTGRPGATGDSLGGRRFLREVYTDAVPEASGRVTVPVLWDKARGTIVSNESAEIIRMLNSAFDGITGNRDDYYPAPLRDEIDAVNARIYDTVNNGVYKAGFATTQAAHEEAVRALFESLDWLEARLSARRYLMGDRITEADWRLFTTLVRFDAVYVGHFKCNIRRIADYASLSGYLRELYQWPGIAATVSLDHIKYHYYASHQTINPTGLVPLGPALELGAPHGRDHLRRAA